MNKCLKYINVQNVLKNFDHRMIVAVTNIVRTYVLEIANIYGTVRQY
jgi:hypothetical protein